MKDNWLKVGARHINLDCVVNVVDFTDPPGHPLIPAVLDIPAVPATPTKPAVPAILGAPAIPAVAPGPPKVELWFSVGYVPKIVFDGDDAKAVLDHFKGCCQDITPKKPH